MHRIRRAISIRWIVVALAVSIARGATHQEQQQLDSAYATAQMVGEAMLHGDYQKVIDFTYPKMMEALGEQDKDPAAMRDFVAHLKAEGFNFTAINFEKPTKVFAAGGRLFTVIPEKLVLTTPDGKTMTQPSYLPAISDDDGKSWKLIDGGTVPSQRLRTMMPDLPADLKLPNDAKPAPASTLSSVDGRLRLRFPEGWEKDEGPSAVNEIWAKDQATGAICMAAWSEKAADTDLATFAVRLKDGVQRSLQDVHAADPKDEQIRGHRAIRFEFTGTSHHGVRCGVLVTAFETDTSFAGIVIKSELAEFTAHRPAFLKLPEGLTESAPKR